MKTRGYLFFQIFFCMAELLVGTQAIAQRRVTGKVLSGTDNTGLSGVSILIKGNTRGVLTDAEGNFSINVQSDADMLVISAIGYSTQQVVVGNQSKLTVIMLEDFSTLSEMVLTGYTRQQKRAITGSITVLKTADLAAVPASTVEQQLQGRVAGVTVTNSGQPGSGSTVRIRGFSAFGNNNPLYVVDGTQTEDISTLNVNDIESMQVLKDAGAASAYGARGSNGVIIISTKNGKMSRLSVYYSAFYGAQNPGKWFAKLLNTKEMADLTWLSLRNAGQIEASNGNPKTAQYGNGPTPVIPDYIVPAGVFERDPSLNFSNYNIDYSKGEIVQFVKANKQGTNWYDEITEVTPIQSHSLGISGGSKNSRYYINLGYFNQQGIVLNTFLKRYNVTTNTDFTIKKNVRIGERLQLSFKENPTIVNQDEGNVISQSYRMQPIIPVYDVFGGYAGTRAANTGNGSNPVAQRGRAKGDKNTDLRLLGNFYTEVDFLKGFTVRTSFGGSLQYGDYYNYAPRPYENSENPGQTRFTEGSTIFSEWNWTNTLAYGKILGFHAFKVLIGTESLSRTLNADTTFTVQINSSSSSTVQTNSTANFVRRLYSLLGRLEYAFNDKYLLTAIIRRDESSTLSKVGYFPSFTLGWRLSEEDFMKGISFVNELKIRGSYGVTGGPRWFWETNTITNAGVDVSLFSGKLELSAEWYRKKTKGLSFRPELYGDVNTASILNKGIDVGITNRGTVVGDLKYDISLTFTQYKNEITSLVPGVDFFDAGQSRIGNFTRNQMGNPLGSFFGHRIIGIFQTPKEVAAAPTQEAAAPGRFRYADVNSLVNGRIIPGADGKIGPEDREFIGNPNPDFTYGINVGITYKNFDFSTFLYGVAGNDIINYVRWWTDFYPSFQGAKSKEALYGSWKNASDRGNGRTPIAENISNFSNNNTPNSYYLEKGSFLRCKQITLGYTFPSTLVNKARIDKLRFYVQAVNLFIITKYTGLDPELQGTDVSFGIDYGNYPNVRQFLFGVNLNF
jgi:TonB-dependent SusC/RagA subfamily outer membrane receptor